MTTPVFELPIGEQLQVAQQKMDARPLPHLGEKVPLYDAHYFKCMLRLYGDTARALKVAPNYTAAADECGVPSGFEFHCSPRAPMWALPFEDRPLAAGTMAFPIAVGPAGERAAQLDVTRMIARRDDTHRAMLTTLDNAAVLGGASDPAAFAGVYWQYTEQQRPTFWAVARAHSPAISAELLQLVRDAEPESAQQVNEYVRERIERHSRFQAALEMRQRAERGEIEADALSREDELRELAAGVDTDVASQRSLAVPYTTWDDFFFRNSDVTRLVEAQRNHRARAVALVLRAAGIPLDERVNELDEQTRLIVRSADALDAAINWVDQVDSADPNSSIVFMANLTSSLSRRSNSPGGGVLLQSSPHQELQLVRGPFHCTHDAIGVPVSTGPRRAEPHVAAGDADADADADADSVGSISAIDLIPPAECVYRPVSHSDPSHLFFARSNWRDRFASEWRAAEKTFVAPRSRNSSTPLRAIAVRLADPQRN